MRKTLFSLILCALIITSGKGSKATKAASKYSGTLTPTQVIAAINDYRTQNGLPPLTNNSTLMALAQAQSDYQASIGNVTHDGPGGTRPKDRAYAAGYGDGNTIFLSEIIYGGYGADVYTAINWWKGSPLHNSVMLDSNYVEIGAGVTTDGDWTYFTAELGWVSGYPAPSPGSTPSDAGEEDTSPPPIIAVPITMATPLPNGSVIHIVRTGQALWTIAAVYEVDLETLLEMNNLTLYSILHPGDEILVVPATLESTQALADPTPTRTSRPTRTPEPQIGDAMSSMDPGNIEEETELEAATYEEERTPSNPSIRWIVILAFATIFIVVVGSMFFQKRPERPKNDDPVR
jgi:hypothetical protein